MNKEIEKLLKGLSQKDKAQADCLKCQIDALTGYGDTKLS